MDQDNVIRWFDVLDRALIECLIYMDEHRYASGLMRLATINHHYQYKKVGYHPDWEKVAAGLLKADHLNAVAALTECVIDDATKERLITLTLEHKGVTLPSSVPPPALHAPL